jgi:trans-aconitate methyltransferase
MSIPDKPRHLQRDYAAQFEDRSIATAYAARPPYPDAVFDTLVELSAAAPREVLELGAGSGDLSLRLSARVDRVDAVEPSEAMLAIARRRAGAQTSSIRFIAASAEAFRPEQAYALVVAAESLHWMDWPVVLPMIGSALRPGAFLAIVTTRALTGLAWQPALGELIARYSTNRDYRTYDLVEELTSRALFREVGRRTLAAGFSQDLEQYVESFHSRNGFSRERMTPSAADAFDRELRGLVRSHVPDGTVAGRVRCDVVWGAPCVSRG